MSSPTALYADLHRHTLSNGLRVVLCPRPAIPLVAVTVHYRVGFRSEPAERTGFAHLFEHLMFQGSECVAPGQHARAVQESGGVSNGSTHQDYTEFHQIAPAEALDRILFLEADRMRAPLITAEHLRTQIDVVKEEIRLNILDRPYGGFPWLRLPAALYRAAHNTHEGYGEFADLDRAGTEDCRSFFDAYYAPGNAVLTVAGGFDPVHALDRVLHHFEHIPTRPCPAARSLDEPSPSRQRTVRYEDRHAPLPAVAVGYRLRGPGEDPAGYLAHLLVSHMLGDGPSARLPRRLAADAVAAESTRAGCGLFAPFDALTPDLLSVSTVHDPATPPEAVQRILEEELAELAAEGPDPEELATARTRTLTAIHRRTDDLLQLTKALGAHEVLHGRAELLHDIIRMLGSITVAEVASAASSLCTAPPAVLLLVPAGTSAGEPVR
ncbi:pitrilysin family protein [Streptomyces sp. CRN 30]|uniref:M16 family metallopeptidase n=1 Tax=Streptomyces sp. CRN 30 TaxID=3075613 RepID=UPI002A82FEAD|nr:pitrilysin family protein [Streptomyces sp. CRN 30]